MVPGLPQPIDPLFVDIIGGNDPSDHDRVSWSISQRYSGKESAPIGRKPQASPLQRRVRLQRKLRFLFREPQAEPAQSLFHTLVKKHTD